MRASEQTQLAFKRRTEGTKRFLGIAFRPDPGSTLRERGHPLHD
jgi:hypothetical protein